MNAPRVINEPDMPADLDAIIRRNLCRAHPAGAETFKDSRSWHDSHPVYTIVLEEAGDVVAHVGVVERTIAVGDGRPEGSGVAKLRSAGIQNVYVLPEFRGKGLSRPVMDLSMAEAGARGYEIGFLFCKPELEKVYVACGWINLGVRKIIRVDQGREIEMAGRNIAMFYPLSIKEFPEGIIHLRGNDW